MSAVTIFPPRAVALPAPRVDRRLLRALEAACVVVGRTRARAAALALPGDIDLPDDAPGAADARQVEPVAPLYLAYELEEAGFLRTAELVAGLFASGAINQPLGPTASLMADFWKGRHGRLDEAERRGVYAQVFGPEDFDPLMTALCEALTRGLDGSSRPEDPHARVVLDEARQALSAWLGSHALGMVAYATEDIVGAVTQAMHFMRDRLLQTAFGVRDLWGLIETVGGASGTTARQIRAHAESGRHGAHVLAWLAGATGRDGVAVVIDVRMAAEEWLLARATSQSPARAS